MNLKIISRKVAEKINQLGYDDFSEYSYPVEETAMFIGAPLKPNELVKTEVVDFLNVESYYAPTYIEVWLWLWKTNKFKHFSPSVHFDKSRIIMLGDRGTTPYLNPEQEQGEIINDNPEDNIVDAIEYIVEHNLI